MKYISCLLVFMLCGCSYRVSHDTKVFILCYKDGEDLKLNGQWLSNELSITCDRRRELGITSRFGVEQYHHHDIITDFKIDNK